MPDLSVRVKLPADPLRHPSILFARADEPVEDPVPCSDEVPAVPWLADEPDDVPIPWLAELPAPLVLPCDPALVCATIHAPHRSSIAVTSNIFRML